MKDIDKIIQQNIRDLVFDGCFRTEDKDKYQKGRDILYDYYLRYYPITRNIETRRMILYNLVYSERMLGNEENVWIYVVQLKNDMESEDGYIEEHMGDYVNMLSYFCDCEFIVLEDSEKLALYKICLKYYETVYSIDKSIDLFERLSNIKFNIHRIHKEYDNMLEILVALNSIDRAEAKSYIPQMLNDIKKLDDNLYNKAIASINICYSI